MFSAARCSFTVSVDYNVHNNPVGFFSDLDHLDLRNRSGHTMVEDISRLTSSTVERYHVLILIISRLLMTRTYRQLQSRTCEKKFRLREARAPALGIMGREMADDRRLLLQLEPRLERIGMKLWLE
jgi:hypothetical protein